MSSTHVLILCLVLSAVVFTVLCVVASRYWNREVSIATHRVERTCDAIMSLIAFLIPATLGLTTWLVEKLNRPWYTAFLAAATVLFLFVLVFTMYMRFNFLWRYGAKMPVGGTQGLSFVYWLISAMFGLVVGIILLGVPVFWIGFKTPVEIPRVESRTSVQLNQNGIKTGNPQTPVHSASRTTPPRHE